MSLFSVSIKSNSNSFSPAFTLEEGLTFLVHKDGKDYCIEGDCDYASTFWSGTLVIRYGEAPADYSAYPLTPVVEKFFPKEYEMIGLCAKRLAEYSALNTVASFLMNKDLEKIRPQIFLEAILAVRKAIEELEKQIEEFEL